MAQAHLAILKKPYLDAILDGRKTIESRFMLTRKPPYGMVRPRDTVFLKISSGLVCAKASIDKVLHYDELTNEKVCKIRERYGADILGSQEYWHKAGRCRYGVLVWLKDVHSIETKKIDKKDWRGWVVLTESRNFGLFA